MTHGVFQTPTPRNEPIRAYAPGSPERESLKRRLAELTAEKVDIPVVIGGQEIRTGDTERVRSPHDHQRDLGVFHQAGPKEVARAIEVAEAARREWSRMPWQERAGVFLRAAELLATTWRDTINAATMLGQSKTAHQAEIDSACELIDFVRFNVHYSERLYSEQPISSPGVWNRLEHRPLDGFVFAITPFNFTAIAGNLTTAPAMLGNTVLWKPASTSMLSNWHWLRLMREAGLPDGVINFLPGRGPVVGDVVLPDRRLGGIHFTGSTSTFQTIWRTVGENIAKYGQYPRLVGETGGKDFVFVHPSAGAQEVAVGLVRGAFEFQGQKCSAASRAYIPRSMWNDVRERMGAMLSEVKVGNVADFRNFMGAVIDAKSFGKLKDVIEAARANPRAELVFGGECDDAEGWFVQPTVIRVDDPRHDGMCTEYFGPILTVYVYDDLKIDETLTLCDTTSEYALTGAIFARDRAFIDKATNALRFAAGNFYVNDKPTGAVVGQQPFGGSRASGTNDKAGSILNLMRWVSPRTIKETFVPATDWRYPVLGAE